jgi:integrase
VQQKTQEVNYLPLPEQALFYLGKRGLKNEKVFSLHNYNVRISRRLQLWCASVGIDKKITFHSERHTFAVLQLFLGTPIHTVQKLLGHTDIASTLV